MDVLQESVMATCTPARRFKAVLVNFKKMRTAPDTPTNSGGGAFIAGCTWQDMLHAVAGLCSVALPDMEESAIYSSLTCSGSKTIILTAEHCDNHSITATATTEQCGSGLAAGGSNQRPASGTKTVKSVVSGSKLHDRESHCIGGTSDGGGSDGVTGASAGGDNGDGDDGDRNVGRLEENSFQEIFSASEASETESVAEDEFSEGHQQFLQACHLRRRQRSPSAPGPEDLVGGCGCFLRLSDRPGGSAVQVLLLAVRHRWRRAGLGSFLLQTMKDPAVVGRYDALLTFADHKAERFFSKHGFSDDPIITAKYSAMVDHWENSSLMAYIPPFSVLSPGNDAVDVGSMAALSLCEDSFKSWRASAITSYCEQLCLMQRLRHEVVLLHGKLESREADIKLLTQRLHQTQREKSTMELEFANYRKHTQRLLCEAAVDKTEQWLDSVHHTR